MRDKNYRDDAPAFDYVASVLHPTLLDNKRKALAETCMQALYLEEGTPLKASRPKAAHVIEQLAIALMGTDWCREWIEKFAPQSKEW